MNCYNIVIIGGGPAGLVSGIYAARARLKSLLLERMIPGGQVVLAEWVENYPGFPEGISGQELMVRMEEQAKRFGLEIESAEATGVKSEEDGRSWLVKTKDKEYHTLAVIIATGAKPAKLNISGEEEFCGKGVSYCATCDGPLFRDKKVLVVGGGDKALSEALFLIKFTPKITLIHRKDRFQATKILQEKVLADSRIEPIWNSIVTEILGEKKVEGVRIKDIKTDEEREIELDGVFISIGLKPDVSFLKGLIDLDRKGFILTDFKMQTSKPGIYAAGDVRSSMFHQITTACGDGAIAALAAQQYIEELKEEQDA
ncbi:TPA: thioredoxin-disulfide reductase [bacterium]|nr:thioredoxin-disulfide reductase [bacterium]